MAYSGLTAKLTLADGSTETDIGYISNFSVEETRDMIEITKFGKKSKEKIPSTYSWTASAEGSADFSTGSGQKLLRIAMIDGKPVKAKFYLDCTEDKAVYLYGEAFVESLSTDIASDDKGNISISLSGTGLLKISSADYTDGLADNDTMPTPPVTPEA